MQRTIVLFIILLNAISFYPQNNFVRSLNIKDGLSQNFIFTLLQDSKGYIWIGTQDGLNRFDGYNFINFKNDVRNINSLNGNVVKSLYEHKNILWIGTGNGVSRYNLETGMFENNKLPVEMVNSLRHKHVTSLLCLNDTLWIGTRSGIYQLNLITNKFYKAHELYESLQLPGKYILQLFEDSHSNIWIGTNGDGCYVFNRNNNELKKLKINENGNASIFSFAETEDKEILIGTSTKGIFIYRDDRQDLIHLDPAELNYHPYVYQIIKLNGSEFILTTSGGVYKYFSKQKKFTKVWEKNDRGIPRAILVDRSGLLWIGTEGRGIFQQAVYPKKFNTYNTTTEPTLTFSSVRCFLIDNKNRFWTGGHTSVNIADYKEGVISNFKKIKVLDGLNIYSILQDPVEEDLFWIGTEGTGLLLYNEKKGSVSRPLNKYFDEKILTTFHEVYSIIKSRTGKIYFGTDKSLVEYDTDDKTVKEIMHNKNDAASIIDRKYKSLFEDIEGNIWIGSDRDGFSILHTHTGGITSFHADEKINSLSSNRINCFCQDNKGTMWIGTENGLNKFNRHSNTFETFNIKNGFANDYIYGILADDKNNLWLSTNKGIIKFNSDTEEAVNFSVDCGLQSDEFNTCAYYKSPAGELFFGGIEGYTSFYPDDIITNDFRPDVIIAGFKKNNEEYSTGKNISYLQEVELTQADVFFSFEFFSTDYLHPQRTQYKYMLHGFNDNWIHADASTRTASFTNIDPGSYTLRITAANSDGRWSDKETVLKIIIHPAYYNTWWFRIISAGMVILVVVLIFRSRINRLKEEKEIQRDLTNQLINSHEEERKIISSELHDDLGQNLLVVKNKLLLCRRDKNYEEQVNGVMEILDTSIRNVSNISHLLHPSELEALGLTQAIESMVYRIESATNLIIENNLDSLDEYFSEEEKINVFRILQEALNNVIKHAEASTVKLESIIEQKDLILKIKDNGRGFNNSDKNIKQERPHLGIKGMKERAWMLNAEMKIISEINKGTTIIIKLKKRSRKYAAE